MRIPFTEPVSPRYIHINPETNKVHLLVPVVGGQEISTDNTCKATVALQEFFDGGALRQLKAYKDALEGDIGLLETDNPQRKAKEARHAQIEVYIEAVSAMRHGYGHAMNIFLGKPSNLYSIQLRPQVQDNQSIVVNPVFTINRKNDLTGTPLSALYNAMHSKFPSFTIATLDPRAALTTAVLSALPETPTFADIQHVLGKEFQLLFGIEETFKRFPNAVGKPTDAIHVLANEEITQSKIDTLMGFTDANTPTTPEDYIDALLGFCTADLWKNLPTPPFYSIPTATSANEKAERLSILTQFFLANLNVYCRAKGISTQNFGTILDASSTLSNELVNAVSTALSSGKDVEGALFDFFNANTNHFGLTRPLNENDFILIRQKFERTYRTVTATRENPHMDDFMILDFEAKGETAKFVTHQGSICVNFAEVVDPVTASANESFFAGMRADFAVHPPEIPHRNESVAGELDLDIEALVANMDDELLKRLPKAVKDACKAHPSFQIRQFLHDVAKGKQDKAEALLKSAANTQDLLRTPGMFTDYSGRTFNCTAYEYAYWARDTHMCHMLERHMDEKSKVEILARIDEMERVDKITGKKVGLEYQQQGKAHHSAHFDLTPLTEALKAFVEGYEVWENTGNWDEMLTALMKVGKAQRDVPAHIAQEYCRIDHEIGPKPVGEGTTWPRKLVTYNTVTRDYDSWFPLAASNSGLGFDFALFQNVDETVRKTSERFKSGYDWDTVEWIAHRWKTDLNYIDMVGDMRTEELKQLRENLIPSATSHGMSM
ncbi:hypothetical protein ACQUW5_15015 [Legionella sp. CNM-1927-20]|uniref:hypothetical protein n=1 Tax=Legionella sp. CNM-1927-20 TaxID=3422221 RepID=UPI00403AC62B